MDSPEQRQPTESTAGTTTMSSSTEFVVWDWRYGINDEKVNALYKKAVSEQWQEDSVNWDYVVDPARGIFTAHQQTILSPELLRPLSKSQQEQLVVLTTADILSQTLHGEQGGLLVSCELAKRVPDKDAKQFAVTQAMDEARHLDVFSRYIRRLGEVYQPCATLCEVLDKILSARHWQAQLVGLHIMVEALALSNFMKIRTSTNCELLRDLLKLIMRDEARHVAFGSNYLKASLQAMHPDDRAEVEDFAVEMVQTYRQWGRTPGDMVNSFSILIQIGVDPMDYLASLKSRLAATGSANMAPQMMQGLDAIIMPGLDRVGLITDRVRHRYLATELKSAVDLRTLEELEQSLLA